MFMKNWWYYHKWYVICGIILLGIACNLIGNALGLWTKTPDFQIAYIGETLLPEDTVSALEQAFSSISQDFNGDGEILVHVNQYITGSQNQDAEAAYYAYASELTLIGDISDCESYFFLMDDPEQFQRNFHLLADSQGNCPPETDYSIKDKAILWKECPALSQLELGSYSTIVLGEEVTGSNQELLSGLSIGRRCFYTGKTADNLEHCSKLWDFLIKNKEEGNAKYFQNAFRGNGR